MQSKYISMECVFCSNDVPEVSHKLKANNNQTPTHKFCFNCLYVSQYVQQLRKYTCSHGL